MPEISVIAPIYGVEQYIHQFMDSVLAQTFKDFELIVVDDGSKDNCPAILDEYALKDSRVKVIHQKNGGVDVARNTGLEAASGRYAYIVDSDDWLEPTALEVLYRDAVKTGADCVMGDCMLRVGEKQYRRKQFSQKFYTDDAKMITAIQQYVLCHKCSPYYSPLCLNGYAAPWGKFIKMSLIKENKIHFDPECKGFLDDVLFSITVANHMKSFYYGMEYVYNYRINDNSITQRVRPDDMIKLKNSLARTEQFIHDNHLENDLSEPYYIHVVRHLIHKAYVFFFPQNSDKTYPEAKKELLATIAEEPYKTAIQKCKLNLFDTKRQIVMAICLKIHFVLGIKLFTCVVRKQAQIRGKRNNAPKDQIG